MPREEEEKGIFYLETPFLKKELLEVRLDIVIIEMDVGKDMQKLHTTFAQKQAGLG